MELVTLAHITLNRIGSASRGVGFQGRQYASVVREVADASPATLQEAVVAVAVEHGEAREALKALQCGRTWSREANQEAFTFNIQGPNTHYSDPYSVCWAHPALKIGGRYFKLDEVSTGKPAASAM